MPVARRAGDPLRALQIGAQAIQPRQPSPRVAGKLAELRPADVTRGQQPVKRRARRSSITPSGRAGVGAGQPPARRPGKLPAPRRALAAHTRRVDSATRLKALAAEQARLLTGAEAVEDHAEEHGDDHHLSGERAWASFQCDHREQAEHERCQAARTHPADEDRLEAGDRRPPRASNTGMTRTTVSASTAYTTTSKGTPAFSTWSTARPNTNHTHSESSVPTSSVSCSASDGRP
jgi:hypothetical protein